MTDGQHDVSGEGDPVVIKPETACRMVICDGCQRIYEKAKDEPEGQNLCLRCEPCNHSWHKLTGTIFEPSEPCPKCHQEAR